MHILIPAHNSFVLTDPSAGRNAVVNPTDSNCANGMWVITHWDHDMEPAILNVYDPDGNRIENATATATNTPTGQGQWPLPSFGLVYRGKPGPASHPGDGIVCVQPAEADGGVLPLGRGN